MNIAVYCGSASGNRPSFTEGAKALGSWIAQNGHTLVYGGCYCVTLNKNFIADFDKEHCHTGILTNRNFFAVGNFGILQKVFYNTF